MPKPDLESRISAYWPVFVSLVMVGIWLTNLRAEVPANSDAIADMKPDHDVLIKVKQRVEDIADHFGIPRHGQP